MSKYRSVTRDNTYFICSCDEEAEFSFTDAYDPFEDCLVCPYCGEVYDYDPEDRPCGFDPLNEDEEEPMSLDEFMHMKGIR